MLTSTSLTTPEDNSVLQPFMLFSSSLVTLLATPKIVIHLMIHEWGTISKAFLKSIYAIPRPVNHRHRHRGRGRGRDRGRGHGCGHGRGRGLLLLLLLLIY